MMGLTGRSRRERLENLALVVDCTGRDARSGEALARDFAHLRYPRRIGIRPGAIGEDRKAL